ncbi:cytosolic sulfotransferase 15 [Gossypium hirsutum]|uniref:Sulfotransferase n=1 Tax=Gossypium hirsutum TaxID=3635 RepID=A0A1U8K0S4_GOSHI|nr:cytosolic sulfotransferase 15-like [Gossypium hirsutum]
MAVVVAEVTWLNGLLREVSPSQFDKSLVFSDSKAALQITANPVFHERTKHIEIDCHFVQDKIKDGTIQMQHIGTTEQLVNLMTKALSIKQHEYLLEDESLEPFSLDEAFDKFYHGIYAYGPFFDHVLGYWKASQENPNKILFLKYEDLKEDINSHLKNLAMFLGVPFTDDEEKQGVVEEIAKICSFENLKEVEVNKKGVHISGIAHTGFFRKGKVGDWSNYLTPFMVERLEKLTQEKMDSLGLTFNLSSKTSKDITSV